MSIRVAIRHRTEYLFDRSVTLSPHQIRLRPATLEKMSQDWRPWRAYAALLLWSPAPGSGG